MPKSLTILSEHSEYLEFQDLRKAGIRHLGNLSGQIWTDHNLHDPGITILEMLCYALTDLDYRTSFDIQDLLARKDRGKAEDNFFTAAEILGCNPLTPRDYRKLLLDIDGVRNAWLEPVISAQVAVGKPPGSNIILVADLFESKLKTIPAGSFKPEIHRKIFINGLYRVYLELEHIRPTVTQDSGQSALNRESILQHVRQVLQEHRNFCEDFLDIVILQDEKIGICADLEITADANPDEVLQKLYSKVQEFLSPSTRFYTLEEMLNRKKTPEEIFEGRSLRPSSHGFIDTAELESMERREAIYISDLYQEILKDVRIRAIRNFHLSSFWTPQGAAASTAVQQPCADSTGSNADSDQSKESNKEWVLKLNPDTHRPVLSPDHSSVMFFKGPIPLQADARRAKEVFENRLANFQKAVLLDQELDLAIPQGTFRELDDYLSIQHEFPLVYGIGVGGLAQTAPAKRKAQARQLQAYLTFFDQLLANYLAQLSNIRNLFSFRPDETQLNYCPEPSLDTLNSFQKPDQRHNQRSYFFQPLLDTPMGEKLIRYFKTNGEQLPQPDAELPYTDGDIIAVAVEPGNSPEAREELIYKTLQAFRNRTAIATIYPEATNGSQQKYRFLIKNQTNDKLLISQRSFKDQHTAMREANALMLIRIKEEQFRRTDEDLLQDSGDYIHGHSFKLIFQPDDYLCMLQQITEDEATFYQRRNGFLDHLLSRFSEKFTDYVLLMYALDGDRRDEQEIVADKERFLQHYPEISRKRGRGFDYTDLRLAKTCEPEQFIFTEPANGKLALPAQALQEGDYRFQFVDLDSGNVLFISNKKNYTRATAESISQAILKYLRIPQDEYSVYKIPEPQNSDSCIWITRDLSVPIVYDIPEKTTGNSGTKRPTQQIIQEILAVTPYNLNESALDRDKFWALFSNGRIASEIKQTDNTTGLERRVAGLMGLNNWQRRTLCYLNQESEISNSFGFQICDGNTNKVLLESRNKQYDKNTAQTLAQDIIDTLQNARDNDKYQLRPLPYGFQSTEHIYSIGIVQLPKAPNTEEELLAIHPATFGTETGRNVLLNEIRNAIENNSIKIEATPSPLIPFLTLENDHQETILTGLMSREKHESINAVLQGFTDPIEKTVEQNRQIREAANDLLRLLGGNQVEYIFFPDPFQKEFYDFQIVHKHYHVANHPRIFQHTSTREKARDELIAYTASAVDNAALYTEFSFEENIQIKVQIKDLNAPAGADKILWQSVAEIPDACQTQAFYFRVIEAAREFDNYTFKETGSGGYNITLNVPAETFQFEYPKTITSQDSAWKKADYLRQRARLFPVNRQEGGFAFFLYKNADVPDFGTDWERNKRRKTWNFNWEDNILWQGIRVFSTIDTALLAFRGALPDPNTGQADPCAEQWAETTFLELIRQNINYERMETNDLLGRRDDLGPFKLEIINPEKVVAVTPPAYRIVQERKNAFEDVETHLFREGFHVVEHILLRPSIEPAGYPIGFVEEDADQADNLLEKCNICPDVKPGDLAFRNNEYLPLTDPFSHWATVILPFWPRRFQNINFRKFFEETLRRETPAHVALRIAWVDPIDLCRFENKYKEWLKALATRNTNILPLRNELLDILFSLENVYPDTNLSGDGTDDSSDGGVVLNFSKLI